MKQLEFDTNLELETKNSELVKLKSENLKKKLTLVDIKLNRKLNHIVKWIGELLKP